MAIKVNDKVRVNSKQFVTFKGIDNEATVIKLKKVGRKNAYIIQFKGEENHFLVSSNEIDLLSKVEKRGDPFQDYDITKIHEGIKLEHQTSKMTDVFLPSGVDMETIATVMYYMDYYMNELEYRFNDIKGNTILRFVSKF